MSSSGHVRSVQRRLDRHLLGAASCLEVIPSDGPIGAEIRGVDLGAVLDAEIVRGIHDAWSEHLVLIFRGQSLSIEQHLAFAA